MYYERYKPTFNLAQVDPGVVTATANVVGGAEMEVRVGYFGICVQPDSGAYICNSNATALAEVLTVDQDPLNLVWVASTFKDAVVFPYLLYVSLYCAPRLSVCILTLEQHHRRHFGFLLLCSSRHVSWMARGN